MTPSEAVYFQVKGRVQGVGFRVFTLRTATALKIAGWVRNRADGAVEGEAEGSPENMLLFLENLGSGPSYGRVDTLDIRPITPSAPFGFEIRG
jgi:acylphosphatase